MLRPMRRSLLQRIHNPGNWRCGCDSACWCKRSRVGYAFRWYVPGRFHRIGSRRRRFASRFARPSYKHEPILFGYKPGAGRRGRGGEGWYGDNGQVSVLEVARPKVSKDHPTMKPLGMLGRRARLMELDPGYCDAIVARWLAHTGATAERITDGAPVEALA